MKIIHFFLLFTLALHINAFADSNVDILLTQHNKSYSVTYKAKQPTSRMSFVGSPDDSRTKRWTPTDQDFQVVKDGENEYIIRKDGKPFKQVKLDLTPTYTHLPKSYAPVAPFSDGGVLIHTGRLFACANDCSEDANGWKIQIKADKGKHFIANGIVHNKTAIWVGHNDGQYVYIGNQIPTEKSNYIAVIDNNLPKTLKTKLDTSLPESMDFFESRLGKNNSKIKPMLYASYSNSKGGDIQGGTLPNQIFIHWDMNNLEEKVSDENFIKRTLWMFGHEAAHFYQNTSSLIEDNSESWIHEGNAEFLASLALGESDANNTFINSKLQDAKTNCASSLKKYTLKDAANNGDYRAYYNCGMVVHSVIDNAVQKSTNGRKSIFDVLKEFENQASTSKELGAVSFWKATQKYVPVESVNLLKKLTREKLTNPMEFINNLESL
ncbi:hypothetical protein FE810_02390 [Thalassotalea litorea]|uniref:M1 family metallopeptidase n=1 Tax=Thalassotalea litorea TaxID=2020715 RepID=A0A5R9INN5_9GAMM|nr:hypothetical protein [Thalassotalea litorea]TLU67154.1 hypothetical protein FE810_02390 [Thalassotalea litorea]